MPTEDCEAPIFPLRALSLRLLKKIDNALAHLAAEQAYADLRIEVKRGKPVRFVVHQDNLLLDERVE